MRSECRLYEVTACLLLVASLWTLEVLSETATPDLKVSSPGFYSTATAPGIAATDSTGFSTDTVDTNAGSEHTRNRSRSLKDRIRRSQRVLANITQALESKTCNDSTLNIHYTTEQYRHAANEAVANANFLSNLWARSPHPSESCTHVQPGQCTGYGYTSVYADSLIVFERIRTAVMANSNIYAAGGCWGSETMSYSCNLTCVYASRNITYEKARKRNMTDQYEVITLADISKVPIEDFIPSGMEPPWFIGPRTNFYSYPASERNKIFGYRTLTGLVNTSTLPGGIHWDTHVSYEHGFWTLPYFDCAIGGEWMISFMMPIVIIPSRTDLGGNHDAKTGAVRYVGTTGVDIELSKLDINQCEHNSGKIFSDDLTDTHFCSDSTACEHVKEGGFKSGSYLCRCKEAYYHSEANSDIVYGDGFKGSDIERYALDLWNSTACRDDPDIYQCLAEMINIRYSCTPCHPSCKNCSDGSSCDYQILVEMVYPLSCFNLLMFCFPVALTVFVVKYRHRKVVKAASWPFLITALVGAMLLYMAVIRPVISTTAFRVRCILDVILETFGFTLLYGSIFIKIWRIQQMISPKFLKKTLVRGQTLNGRSIASRLIILQAATCIYLIVWIVVSSPKLNFKDGEAHGTLNYYRCDRGPFGYVTAAAKLALMLWGAFLCQRTRNVAAQFTDSRELSIVIYSFIIVLALALTIEYTLASGKSDQQLLIDTVRTQMTVTVTLVIIFVPKVKDVYHSSRYHRRRIFKQRKNSVGGMSQMSVHSLDRSKSINRSSRGSVLSRSRLSTNAIVGIPLEKRPSRVSVSSGSSNVSSPQFSGGYPSLVQRTSSVGRMSPHKELDDSSTE